MDTKEINQVAADFQRAHLFYLYSKKELENKLTEIARTYPKGKVNMLEILMRENPTLVQDHYRRMNDYFRAYYRKNSQDPLIHRTMAQRRSEAAMTMLRFGKEDEAVSQLDFGKAAIVQHCLAALIQYRQRPTLTTAQQFIIAMGEVQGYNADNNSEIIRILPEFNQACEFLKEEAKRRASLL